MKHSLRIIGGTWKGHRLKVPSLRGLRPTSDFIRETLFNWLGQRITGANVVDLFAGTGSLGFEALSRGAAHATFVERNWRATRMLRTACHQFNLSASEASVVSANCISWLKSKNARWDIVFVDPPFERTELYGKVLQELLAHLSSDSIVYLEFSKRCSVERLDYSTWKSSVAGEVQFELLLPPKVSACPAKLASKNS
ncbi:MAG: 16S rRNA (guanine(966)-N(2))-methyltransferase RsmD [Gammaproteobacteria bacterium]|nr:16S rRNA (guanine(966)-N(2))-methyltransferase RsmD [Gammaproteobacteria bacterium]